MMHYFGFPFFMGGPIVWVAVLIGGFFIIRKILLPRMGSRNAFDRQKRRVEASGDGVSEAEIYRLAAGHNGELTVSDLVTEFGIEPKEAQKRLESMTDEVRVRMEVDENGMILYTFPELKRNS